MFLSSKPYRQATETIDRCPPDSPRPSPNFLPRGADFYADAILLVGQGYFDRWFHVSIYAWPSLGSTGVNTYR